MAALSHCVAEIFQNITAKLSSSLAAVVVGADAPHRFGSIGHRVAQLAQAYGMRVLALRRNAHKSQAELDSGLLVRERERESCWWSTCYCCLISCLGGIDDD